MEKQNYFERKASRWPTAVVGAPQVVGRTQVLDGQSSGAVVDAFLDLLAGQVLFERLFGQLHSSSSGKAQPIN